MVVAEIRPVFRIASNVSPGQGEPYVDMFYRSLAEHGIECGNDWRPLDQVLRAQNSRVDALHFHWPERIWRNVSPLWVDKLAAVRGTWRLRGWERRLRRPAAVARFVHMVSRARSKGKKIIWTVHNVEPHENGSWLDRQGNRFLARHSDLVICHSRESRDLILRQHAPAGNTIVMYHGNYEGVFPPSRPREQVRRDLGLDPRKPLLCCPGWIRRYKGIDIAVNAVRRLNGDVQLLVAGGLYPEMRHLPGLLAELPYCRLKEGTLSDQEFSDYVAASDAVLLPYRRITGSGLLLAALTLGRGVIASDLPYFREILGYGPDAGALFPCGDPQGLTAAIVSYLTHPTVARHAAARRLADHFNWQSVMAPVVRVIDAWRTEVTRNHHESGSRQDH